MHELRAPHSAAIARLLPSCVDRRGIVAEIASSVRGAGANIVQPDQNTTDPDGGRLFERTMEQDIARVAHGDTPGDRTRIGRDVERTAPERSVRRRRGCVLVDGDRTVVLGQ